jgi:hypothetical protein
MAKFPRPFFNAAPRQSRILTLEGGASYECPVCRHGQIEAMALMDAYACNFCRHILEANLDQQTVHLVDGIQPMGWRWQGWRWQPLHHPAADLTLTLWIVGLALILFPAGLVVLGGYVFPPLDEADQGHWSLVWASITLLAHTAMVGWIIAEHYQFPYSVLAKVRVQRLLARLPG